MADPVAVGAGAAASSSAPTAAVASGSAGAGGKSTGGLDADTMFNLVIAGLIALVLLWRAWKSHVAKSKRGEGKQREAPRPGGGDEQREYREHRQCATAEPSRPPPPPAKEEYYEDDSEHEDGEEMDMITDDIHFGLPRVRLMVKGSDTMGKMLKWPVEQLADQKVEVARVRMGTFSAWVAQGMSSNRILYAMKKREDCPKARCVVVPPPEPRKLEEGEDEQDFPDTYGPDLQKVQLIP